VIEKLWNKNKIEYPKMHRDYEPVLKLDPKNDLDILASLSGYIAVSALVSNEIDA